MNTTRHHNTAGTAGTPVLALLLTAVFLMMTVQAFAGDGAALLSADDRASYSAGVEFARSLRQKSGTVNLNLVVQGMQDELSGAPLLVPGDIKEARSAAPAGGQAAPAAKPEAVQPRQEQDDQDAQVAAREKEKPAPSVVPHRYQKPRFSRIERLQKRRQAIAAEQARHPAVPQHKPEPEPMPPAGEITDMDMTQSPAPGSGPGMEDIMQKESE